MGANAPHANGAKCHRHSTEIHAVKAHQWGPDDQSTAVPREIKDEGPQNAMSSDQMPFPFAIVVGLNWVPIWANILVSRLYSASKLILEASFAPIAPAIP
jgi:hypothetical protein